MIENDKFQDLIGVLSDEIIIEYLDLTLEYHLELRLSIFAK